MQRGNASVMAGANSWKDQIFEAFTVQAGKCLFFLKIYKGISFLKKGTRSDEYLLFLRCLEIYLYMYCLLDLVLSLQSNHFHAIFT